jgi:hypothetical protein
LIDILPEEQNQEGYGCINGIDIFKYNRYYFPGYFVLY